MTSKRRRIPDWMAPVALIVLVGLGAWFFVFREEDSERFDRLVTEARQAMDSKEYKAAERLLNEALRLTPDNPIVLHNLGVLHLDEGRRVEARAAFERAAALHSPEANEVRAEELFNLARISVMERNWEQAASELDRAIAAHPTRPLLHTRLLDVQLGRLRDREAADSTASRYLRLFGRTAQNLHDLAYVYYQGTLFRDSEALARQATEISDSLVASHALVAQSMWRSNRIKEGLKYLETTLRRYPDAPELWIAQASLLQASDRSQEALASADRALEKAPNAYSAHHVRHLALGSLDRIEEALQEISICLKLTTHPGERRALQSRRGVLQRKLQAERTQKTVPTEGLP